MNLVFKITPTQTVEQLVSNFKKVIEKRAALKGKDVEIQLDLEVKPTTVEELLSRKKIKREDL
jgi:hypothetical protein